MVVLRFHFHSLLWLISTTTALLLLLSASGDHLDSPDCLRRCGDIYIPYPFGLTKNCCLDHNFLLQCDNSSGHPMPLIGTKNLTVTRISVEPPEMSILFDVTRDCYTESGQRIKSKKSATLTPPNTMFTFSHKNMFTVVGCESYSILTANNNNQSGGLLLISLCSSLDDIKSGAFSSALGCSQKPIYGRFQNITFEANSYNNHNDTRDFNNCTYAFVVEQDQFNFSQHYVTNFPLEKLPVALDWAISNEYDTCGRNSRRHGLDDGSLYYYCLCNDGFQGNPYDLGNGCQDINECENPSLNNCSETRYCVNKQGSYTCSCPSLFKGDGRRGGAGCKDQLPAIKVAIGVAIGFVTLLVSGTWIYLVYKQRKLIKLKDKFFRQNGGLILQQRLSRQEHNNEMAKIIFTQQELRKATHNYDESTIIGKGGFGIVYKGTLPDNRIVAIKKSKIVDQTQIGQFINEVVVLSQINHRNVVKLLGCCLETEVPLLVYEFVPNGNLFEHIHTRNKASNFLWETRLGIAAETAGALSYLHSAASTPIIHRDVKSSNILLDNSMTAKVSDFGASRLIPLGQTEVATMVQGTLGYLDPEYLQTNQLTEKSDVYSFGVVLVELLTGQKALSFNRPEEKRNLAMHFLHSLVEDQLYEILESHMVNEENREQLKEVADLARRCLSLKGEDRPTMKEVAMELEGIRRTERHPWVKTELNLEETERLLNAQTTNAYKDYGRSVSNNAITLDFSGR